MVTLHDDYSPLKCMQSVILRAVDVVDAVYFAFSVCYNELFFFLQNQHVFIMKVSCTNSFVNNLLLNSQIENHALRHQLVILFKNLRFGVEC